MKVRFQRLMCSPTRTVRPGQIVDLPEDEARRRIKAGHCVPMEEPRPSLRERLRGRGKAPADDGQQPSSGGKPLEKHNVDQLKALAAERGIDLGDATKKAQIIQVIQEADAEADDGGGE